MLSRARRLLGRLYYQIYDALLYFKHKLRGTTYADYYAERMDIRISKNRRWGLNQDKTFQLEYLIRHGLRKESDLLDYGCGALAAGLHFISYLDANKYCGADISSKVLQEGMRRVKDYGLETKQPSLVHIPSGQLDNLKDRKFDIIWAQSVLTHMPPEAIEYLFSNIRDLLKKDGKFMANFKCASGNRTKHVNFRDWQYTTDSIEKIANKYGLKFKIMNDWVHPYDRDKQDTMIMLTGCEK